MRSLAVVSMVSRLTGIMWGIAIIEACVVTVLVFAAGASAAGEGSPGGHPADPAAAAAPIFMRVQAIAAGYSHTCALTDQGVVFCWGSNLIGELGDGTTEARPQPGPVMGLEHEVRAIVAGYHFTCALMAAGTVKCWGANLWQQANSGQPIYFPQPVEVAGINNIKALAAGAYHACALNTSGGVLCWGSNFEGQLGDGTTEYRAGPVQVSGIAGGARTLAAGGQHTCVTVDGNNVKCWGSNSYGQLGNEQGLIHATPVTVAGLANVRELALGSFSSCARRDDAVLCWGDNTSGQLGDGSYISRPHPEPVTGLGRGVQAMTMGHMHGCAVTAAGALWCWGNNATGQMGDGTAAPHPMAMAVPGFGAGTGPVSGGWGHTCALAAGGALKCWGRNEFGELGRGTFAFAPRPEGVPGLSDGIRKVAAGSNHTCALTEAGSMRCWGANTLGQLGNSTDYSQYAPGDVLGLASGVIDIAVGYLHTCAVVRDAADSATGGVRCWGWNLSGQLGDGTQETQHIPVAVVGLGRGVQAVVAGERHTCALVAGEPATGGAVQCWGSNRGIDTTVPITVPGLASGVKALAAGGNTTCAVMLDGKTRCWGQYDDAYPGPGVPGVVPGLETGVRGTSSNLEHSCAWLGTGGAKCWGANRAGQLGDGTTEDRPTPVSVVGLDGAATAVSAGGNHTCALTDAANGSGLVVCWGSNEFGQLGDGTTIGSLQPQPVDGLGPGVHSISAGNNYTCAVTASGGVTCWGSNADGVRGVDPGWSPQDVLMPVRPLFLPYVAGQR